jgi:hypothetical protein
MLPGQWGGHMWNEVYVGRWIPVDAGYNEVGTAFALVKLIDHETVEGTMPLRHALPASLAIAIRDHRAQPSSLAGTFRTGIAGRVYTNVDLGCRITAPGDDWTIEEVKQPGAVIMRFKRPGKDDVQLHFVAFALSAPIDSKTLLGIRRKFYEANLKGFAAITDEKHAVNGLAGHRLEFRQTPVKGKSRRAIDVVWRKPTSGYLLTLNTEEADFDAIRASFSAILGSFEDLERK